MKKLGLIASMVSLFSLWNAAGATGASASSFADVSGRLGVTDGVAGETVETRPIP
ncbi:hypothetical protein GCM10008018_44020 [Paenibacillus marchantiophytorum]|uniref:Uncharacterized protein n=1 Tax=Paenibacillus marchantiophytorum TaxID=1619310 RepID=A0ABQ1EYF2_9BACL|nr:hypothetical protein [Paenibacillus marchantiophytorum]GFZ92751.1 hypothetical protein GCM10008018_44020 [Paenibacillus marchantiophytorum]